MWYTYVFITTDFCEKKYSTAVLTKQWHGKKVVIYTVETFLITPRKILERRKTLSRGQTKQKTKYEKYLFIYAPSDVHNIL